jgi:hypothetical protein
VTATIVVAIGLFTIAGRLRPNVGVHPASQESVHAGHR